MIRRSNPGGMWAGGGLVWITYGMPGMADRNPRAVHTESDSRTQDHGDADTSAHISLKIRTLTGEALTL